MTEEVWEAISKAILRATERMESNMANMVEDCLIEFNKKKKKEIEK